MKKVLVAGMGRAGSTLLYNIVRKVLSDDSREGTKISAGLCFGKLPKDLPTVGKYHEFDKNLINHYDYIFLPLRNPVDTLISHNKYKPETYKNLSDLIKQGFHLIDIHNSWLPFSNYIFNYDSYIKDPIKSISKIIKFLDSSIDPQVVLEYVNDFEKLVRDPLSLVDLNHRTTDKETDLSLDDIRYIKETFKHWPKEC